MRAKRAIVEERLAPSCVHSQLRRRGLGAAAAGTALALAGCGSGNSNPPPPAVATRSWRMGFSALPPRNNLDDALRTIDLWSTRADMAAIHDEPPYTELLAGTSPDVILQRDKAGLVDFYRSKGMQLMYMADLTDSIKSAMGKVDPTPYFQKYGNNAWAGVKEYLDEVTRTAAAPVIRKYTGVLAAADVYTENTTFWVMESVRLDLGFGSQIHP